MMRRLALAVLLISLLCCARFAAAQTCTFSVTAMNFGSYTDSGGNTALAGTATGTWTQTRNGCSGSWTIPLYAGNGKGATETTRYMTGPGSAEIAYEVFQDSTHQTNWGDTTGTEKAGNTYTNVTFYGLIPAGQFPAPGTYTDTLTTATASFSVSVTVASSCTITATNLAFGNYTATATSTSTSTISVTCTNTTPYNVGLSAGAGGSVTTRMMKNGTNSLNYSLYQNSTHTTNWGNTVGTDTETGTGNGATQALTVYGQVPAGQFARALAYTDTITATVTY
jgi:spore coat protein U-like protein